MGIRLAKMYEFMSILLKIRLKPQRKLYHISNDSSAYEILSRNSKENDENAKLIDEFFRVIAICHTVVTG